MGMMPVYPNATTFIDGAKRRFEPHELDRGYALRHALMVSAILMLVGLLVLTL